jgi:hypothetical protein
MTECNQDRFGFASVGGSREIVAEFSGGTISSDGGGLLLQETDSRMNLLTRFSQCFVDLRNPDLIEHSVEQLIRQRVFALALGYEDLNDHDQLRQDPLLGVMSGKAEPGTELLAGKSTLNRMELGTGMPTRYKKITFWRDSVDELLVNIFLEAHPVAPQQIVLDIDTTDLALHGKQEDRFYHGYYKHYCYLPLYIFCGDHVLCARLRPSSIGPAVGRPKGSRAHRPADPPMLAGSGDHPARRLGVLLERTDDMVRAARPHGIRSGHGSEPASGRPPCCSFGRSQAAV